MTWVSNSAYSLLESVGYRPRELYTFARNNQVWRLTGGTSLLSAIVGRSGLTYAPGLVTRDAISRTEESRSSTITVRVARTTAVADALREVHSAPMTLRIERWQDKASDNPVPVVLAIGPVGNVRTTGGWVEMDVDTSEADFTLPFPTRVISRQNQWPVLSEFTGVDEAAFSFETTITAITRSKVTVAAKAGGTADGYYDGGKIRVGAIADHGEAMFVRYSTGLDFFVNGRVVSGLAIGDTVTLVAGDDRSLATARDTFGQQAVKTFLGFDLLPTTDVLQTGLHDSAAYLSPYRTPTGSPAGAPVPDTPVGLTVTQGAVETPGGVTLFLTVDDPTHMLELLEARWNLTGFTPDWTAFATISPTTSGGTIYRIDLSKGPAGAIQIEVRTSYLDPTDHTVHTQTVPLQYNGGLTFETTLTEGGGSLPANYVVIAETPGTLEERGYLTVTHDDVIVFPSGGGRTFDVGWRMVLSLDARGGPFTLTFGQLPDGRPVTDLIFLDGAIVTSLTVNGLVYFELVIDGGFGFAFRRLT